MPTKTQSLVRSCGERRQDFSWDYRGENTKSHTHGIHTYPAMFIPQVASRLLDTYSKEGDTVCDIFCGSGTSLVESKLMGRNAYGIDLNPLAVFLAKAKSTPINPKKLYTQHELLMDKLGKIKEKDVEIPAFKNIDFWFKAEIAFKLAKLKLAIQEIEDEKIQNFFKVCFSEIVRLTSNTKSGEFKLVRIKEDVLENHDPNVFEIFSKKLLFNISGMEKFYRDANRKVWSRIILGDSSKYKRIKEASIDFLITSPPYGDSRTTVAYGQFSRLSAQWLDIFEDPNSASGVDKELLGGVVEDDLSLDLMSESLKGSLKRIVKRDEKRAGEVLSFYKGLNECLKNAYKMLKPKKYFCIVIGNRMVKQVRLPSDFIIAELGENIGFKRKDIFVRNIPGKRMPRQNSPTNVSGKREKTMTTESIVVLQKSK